MDRSNIDRGWACVVMVTSCIGMTIVGLSVYMGGVVYIALLDKFHESAAMTSLVGAVSGGLHCFIASFAGILINKFSCRVAIMTGGVLTTLGYGVSVAVPTLDWMIFTAGILVGIGYGIVIAGIFCALGYYFEKRRDFVLSFVKVMTAVGMFISTPLGLFLKDHLGLNGIMFTLASLNAHLCLLGALGRPSAIEVEVHAHRAMVKRNQTAVRQTSFIYVTLIKDIPFLLFLFSTSTWNFALNGCLTHLPNYVSVIGDSDMIVGQIMMAFAVANVIGSLFGSLTASRFSGKSFYVHIAVMAIAGVLTSTFPFYVRFTAGLSLFTIQLGLCCGWVNCLLTPISISFVGITKIAEAHGLSFFFCGLGMTTGPVSIGYLYGVTRSYEYSFVVAGVILLIGSMCGVVALCLRKEPVEQTEIELVCKEKKTLLTSLPSDKCKHSSETEDGLPKDEEKLK